MRKLKTLDLEKLSGGLASPWCYLLAGYFPPIGVGCLMKNIDGWLGN